MKKKTTYKECIIANATEHVFIACAVARNSADGSLLMATQKLLNLI